MTSNTECIAALRTAAERLGESPTKAQYEELGLTPASATIIRVMGGWNAAKEVAELETYASRGSRVGTKPDHVDVSDDTWASMSVDQRWHYRNVAHNAQRTLARRQRLRQWLRIHKNSLGCAACGETDAACLDFHHTTEEKTRAVNKMVTYGYSAAAIHEELQKCEVLCANCHRKEHAHEMNNAATELITRHSVSELEEYLGIGDRTPAPACSLSKAERLRIWTIGVRQASGCQGCSETDPACLEFHHPRPAEKVGSVAAMISNSRPESAVVAEVERCIVLCANCHRRHHDSPPKLYD